MQIKLAPRLGVLGMADGGWRMADGRRQKAEGGWSPARRGVVCALDQTMTGARGIHYLYMGGAHTALHLYVIFWRTRVLSMLAEVGAHRSWTGGCRAREAYCWACSPRRRLGLSPQPCPALSSIPVGCLG